MPRALLVLALAAAVLPPLAAADPPGIHVHIDGFAYVPGTASLLAGEWVTFHNHDTTAHRATADDLSFETPTLSQGESWPVHFPAAATVPYYCEFHTAMTGLLLVSEAGARPDLAVPALQPVDVVPGVVLHLNFTVRNLGRAETGPSTLEASYRYHGNDYPIGTAATPGLGPGASVVVTVPWLAAGKVGEFLVSGEADAFGEVEEAREDNNVGQDRVAILLEGFPGLDLLRPL